MGILDFLFGKKEKTIELEYSFKAEVVMDNKATYEIPLYKNPKWPWNKDISLNFDFPKRLPNIKSDPKTGICPHCNQIIDPFPSRKRKCPNCKNIVAVFTWEKKKGLVKEGFIKPFKADLKVAKEQRRNKVNKLRPLDLTFHSKESEEKHYNHVVEFMDKFQNASAVDGSWSFANQYINEQIKRSSPNWHELQMLYFGMALHLSRTGKEWKKLSKESFKCQIRELQKDDLTSKMEYLTDSCCDECKKFNGKKIKIPQDLNSIQFPVDVCSNEWCNCSFLGVFE